MKLIPYRQNAADIEAIVRLLDTAGIGTIVTYDEMSAAINRDILKHRYLLQSAVTEMLKNGMVFECIVRVGMKRMSDSEIIANAPLDLKRLRKKAKRSAAKLVSVGWDHLTTEEQKNHNLYISALGAIAYASCEKNFGKLESACRNGNQNGLPTATTLKLLAS